MNVSKAPPDNITSNGYGSFINKVTVRVDLKHVETFSGAFGVKPFRTTPDHADFVVTASSRYRSDDEGVLYDIDARLPDTIPRNAWSVVWGESGY